MSEMQARSPRQVTGDVAPQQEQQTEQPQTQARGAQPQRPTAQEIADRVYELFCEDLRLERERRGW